MAESIDEYCSWQTEEIPKSNDTFAWQDYLILGCTLGISTVIGVYFAWKDRNKNADEYMMGGGNVSPYPIAMSLATTFFSGHGFLFYAGLTRLLTLTGKMTNNLSAKIYCFLYFRPKMAERSVVSKCLK